MTQNPIGIRETIEIDGSLLTFGAESLSIDPSRTEDAVKTLSDTKLYRQYAMAGLPNVEESFRITLPIGGLATPEEVRAAERLRLLGGFHTAALWKYERAYYTATAGQTAFYIARRRRDAASVKGIANLYPALAWKNDVALTVVMIAGSAPSVPVAGVVNIADTPIASGDYLDYTKFRVAACGAGDVLELAVMPLFRVYVEAPRVDFPSGTQERHNLVLVER
jgi:hypothetical protein